MPVVAPGGGGRQRHQNRLGAAAGHLTGFIGVIGGLAVIALSLNHRRVPPALLIIAVVVAASPFAIVTWWSIITPVTAAQIIVIAAVLGHQDRDPAQNRDLMPTRTHQVETEAEAR